MNNRIDPAPRPQPIFTKQPVPDCWRLVINETKLGARDAADSHRPRFSHQLPSISSGQSKSPSGSGSKSAAAGRPSRNLHAPARFASHIAQACMGPWAGVTKHGRQRAARMTRRLTQALRLVCGMASDGFAASRCDSADDGRPLVAASCLRVNESATSGARPCGLGECLACLCHFGRRCPAILLLLLLFVVLFAAVEPATNRPHSPSHRMHLGLSRPGRPQGSPRPGSASRDAASRCHGQGTVRGCPRLVPGRMPMRRRAALLQYRLTIAGDAPTGALHACAEWPRMCSKNRLC